MAPGNDFFLEVLNGNWSLAAIALTIICAIYLLHELAAEFAKSGRGDLSWRARLTLGMRVALAVMTLSVGVAIRSLEVTRWRIMDGGDPSKLNQAWLGVGGTMALLGFLCCIREISKPLYGDRPWLYTLAAMVIYTAVSGAARFM